MFGHGYRKRTISLPSGLAYMREGGSGDKTVRTVHPWTARIPGLAGKHSANYISATAETYPISSEPLSCMVNKQKQDVVKD